MKCADPSSLPTAKHPAARAPAAVAADSHDPAEKPRPKAQQFGASALQQIPYWTIPEAAFMSRVGVRTVWRLMADPDSGFPRPRRIGRRTLLARDEVLAFLAEGARS